MRNITGNPVSGSDFHGRQSELKILRRTIENGNHVLILAPRRVGKSSVVEECSRILSSEGWKTVNVDVQHAEDEAGFLQLLYEAIDESEVKLDQTVSERIRAGINGFRSLLRGTKVGGAGVQLEVSENETAWEDSAGPLRAQIGRLAKSNDRILFTMDELPIFLNQLLDRPDGQKRVERILNWLRSVRQACGSGLPWVLCGSIGLDTFVQTHGLEGSISDLTEMSVGAINREDATDLLQRLAAAEPETDTLPAEVIGEILNRCGWLLPYYLQLMFHCMMSIPDNKRSSGFPCVADVDAAYAAAVGTKNLGHWSSRLNDLLQPDERRRAHLMLTAVAHAEDGLTRKQLQGRLLADSKSSDPEALQQLVRRLLRLLEDDGYVVEADGTVRFRSFLLRDFWKREYPV